MDIGYHTPVQVRAYGIDMASTDSTASAINLNNASLTEIQMYKTMLY